MSSAGNPRVIRLLLVLLCAALLLPGCRGCNDPQTPAERAAAKKAEEQRKKEEEEKKKKRPMVIHPLRPYPSVADQPLLYVKPGHWMTYSQQMVRNYDNWVGHAQQSVVDKNGEPVALPRTRFSVQSERPIALSKGQPRDVASVVFAPPVPQTPDVAWSVTGRDGLGERLEDTALTSGLLPHQYNVLVLAENPASYGRLRSLRSVDAPLPVLGAEVLERNGYLPARRQYRVITPELGDRPPLPDSLARLTSFAYVLWDEVNPEQLDPAQRDALLDWLHWGGGLIISGPDSLALLQGSFLEPYLPAQGGESWEISQQDLQPMADRYGVGRRGPRLSVTRPWSGIRLKVVEDTAARHRSDRAVARATAQLNTGALFAERRVGRGRVIVSAVRLNSRALQNWQNGFECLVNGVLLRRPGRRFLDPTASIENDLGGFDQPTPVVWAEGDRLAIDAGVNSQLRLMSRDTYKSADAWRYRIRLVEEGGPAGPTIETLVPPEYPGGVGGWDDFNQVSNAARDALREAAGVAVPGAGFVVGCVAIYLLVLGPLNWLVFRILGRVELAWVAAPLIALAGTVVVVKQAQLDIGFVRAQTEIALLETQPNYPRGLLTRYTGMYTSLATTYEFTFDDPHAVAAPFASREDFRLLAGQAISPVTYDYQDKARLKGLAISSNSTEMVHSEEMHNAPAAVRLGVSASGLLQLENPTDWALRHVAVVYRPRDERPGDKAATLTGCWIGDLAPRDSAILNWTPVSSDGDQAPYAQQRRKDQPSDPSALLNLEPLWRIALDAQQFEPGEYRCVARIDQSLTGMTVAPAAAQQTAATLLAAHLQYELPPAPEPDANAPIDVQKRDQ